MGGPSVSRRAVAVVVSVGLAASEQLASERRPRLRVHRASGWLFHGRSVHVAVAASNVRRHGHGVLTCPAHWQFAGGFCFRRGPGGSARGRQRLVVAATLRRPT